MPQERAHPGLGGPLVSWPQRRPAAVRKAGRLRGEALGVTAAVRGVACGSCCAYNDHTAATVEQAASLPPRPTNHGNRKMVSFRVPPAGQNSGSVPNLVTVTFARGDGNSARAHHIELLRVVWPLTGAPHRGPHNTQSSGYVGPPSADARNARFAACGDRPAGLVLAAMGTGMSRPADGATARMITCPDLD